MTAGALREYVATARSTGTFGRVLWNVRDHFFVADGPASNGCPGVAVSPGEMFLASIGACSVELIEVLARQGGVDLEGVDARVRGVLGGGSSGEGGVTLFDSIHIRIIADGVSQQQADELVHGFKSL